MVTDVNTKYTPRITLYQLATGKDVVVKVKKDKFYDDHENMRQHPGEIIDVLTTEKVNKRRLVDGKWTELNEKEMYLTSLTKVKDKIIHI